MALLTGNTVVFTFADSSNCTVEPRYNGLAYNVHSFITYCAARSRRFSMGKCTDITYSDITYSRLERTPITVRSVQMTPFITYTCITDTAIPVDAVIVYKLRRCTAYLYVY
jgi:hypothetical protein